MDAPTSGQGLEPPRPPGAHVSANARAYEEDRLGFLLAAERAYGPIVRFDQGTTIVNDPRLVHRILHDNDFRSRRKLLVEDVLEDEQHSWLGLRLLDPGIRPPRVEGLALTVAQVVDEVFAGVTGAPAPATEILDRVTSRAMTRFCFGNDERGVTDAVGRLVDALAAIVENPSTRPPSWPTPARSRARRRLRELQGLLEPLVRARALRPYGHADYATRLINRRDDSGQATERVVMSLIGTMLGAHRVPAAASGWALMLSRGRAPTWSAVKTESGVLAARRSSGAAMSLADLPATMAAVQESLRLYPPTWLLSREATSRVEVGGYRFAPGHRFMVSPYVLHRHASVFPDPEGFRPERWRATTFDMRARYLPFGAGTGTWPGSHLTTIVMIGTLLAATAWKVRVIDDDVRADAGTTLLPRGLALEVLGRSTRGT